MNLGTWISGWLQEPGFRVTPGPLVLGDSGKPELQVTPGTRSSMWLREPGIPCDSGNPEFRLTPGTRIFVWLREPGFTGDSGKPDFRGLREPAVPDDSGNPEFQVTKGTRSSEWLQEHGFPGESGIPEFRATPWNRSFRWLREWKIPFTQTGIEIATFLLVAQCLNSLNHRVASHVLSH